MDNVGARVGLGLQLVRVEFVRRWVLTTVSFL
jgi:hypothetical protein